MTRSLLAVVLLVAPAAAHAQAERCAIPATLERPHLDRATPDQPRRLLPISGYTLALSWSPQQCRRRGDDRFQCGGDNRFGWTLHGLWPDGVGKEWPQYCRAASVLPDAVVRANLCATPSPQLLQHEWAKHGTCMPGLRPRSYFVRSSSLFSRLRFPDMDALSRRSLTADDLAQGLAQANPGLPANAVRVTTTRDGWLDELWLCMDRGFRYVRCRADSGGVGAGSTARIWRGRR